MLLYMNTIETPIYKELNEACRNMDKTKLHFFGPFARALGLLLSLGIVSGITEFGSTAVASSASLSPAPNSNDAVIHGCTTQK